MKYNEFKEEIENWGRKHNHKPVVEVGINDICVVSEGDYLPHTIG